MTTGEVMSAAQPSRAPQAAVLAVVVALLLGGGAWWLSRGTTSDRVEPRTEHKAPAVPVEEAVGAPPVVVAKEPADPQPLKPPEPEQPLNSGPPLPPLPMQPTAAVDAGTAPAIAKAAPAPASLSGKASVRQVPFWAVTITNTSPVRWSGCTLFIQDQRRYAMGALGPKMSREVPLDRFTVDAMAPALVNQVRVQCAQGNLTLPLQ